MLTLHVVVEASEKTVCDAVSTLRAKVLKLLKLRCGIEAQRVPRFGNLKIVLKRSLQTSPQALRQFLSDLVVFLFMSENRTVATCPLRMVGSHVEYNGGFIPERDADLECETPNAGRIIVPPPLHTPVLHLGVRGPDVSIATDLHVIPNVVAELSRKLGYAQFVTQAVGGHIYEDGYVVDSWRGRAILSLGNSCRWPKQHSKDQRTVSHDVPGTASHEWDSGKNLTCLYVKVRCSLNGLFGAICVPESPHHGPSSLAS